jgi:hypothetical protein
MALQKFDRSSGWTCALPHPQELYFEFGLGACKVSEFSTGNMRGRSCFCASR